MMLINFSTHNIMFVMIKFIILFVSCLWCLVEVRKSLYLIANQTISGSDIHHKGDHQLRFFQLARSIASVK